MFYSNADEASNDEFPLATFSLLAISVVYASW
jgi:hypothetical protein